MAQEEAAKLTKAAEAEAKAARIADRRQMLAFNNEKKEAGAVARAAKAAAKEAAAATAPADTEGHPAQLKGGGKRARVAESAVDGARTPIQRFSNVL